MNIHAIDTIITDLLTEEQETKRKLQRAEELQEQAWERVKLWEEAYATSDEAESVGKVLDETYEEYDEAIQATDELNERLEVIEDALEALKRAASTLKWLKQ